MEIQEKLNCNVKLLSLTMNVNMAEERWREFGAWLSGEREKTEVIQKTAAKKAGIHAVQLSRIENGSSGVKRETVIDLVDALNELSKDYKISKSEALNRAGFAEIGQNDDELTAEITSDLKISLFGGGKGLSKEDRKEIIDAAVLIAKGKIAKNEEDKQK